LHRFRAACQVALEFNAKRFSVLGNGRIHIYKFIRKQLPALPFPPAS
jgi:hypothetical protein